MAILATPVHDADVPRVLSEAVGRVADLWQLFNARLGVVIGLSASTLSRLRSGGYRLEPGSKPFELTQHSLRLF